MKIIYKTGDLFSEPITSQTIIAHVVNNIGAWGSGFVIPLGKYYPQSREAYIEYYKSHQLGDVQRVIINDNLSVVNMFAQDGISNYKSNKNYKPFQYGYFALCILKLNRLCRDENYKNVYMPLVGAGLGGGDWNVIEEIIENLLVIPPVTVFQLKGQELR